MKGCEKVNCDRYTEGLYNNCDLLSDDSDSCLSAENKWYEKKKEQTASGIQLRDYFAAKSVMGLIPYYFGTGARAYGNLACEAYQIADAMLKEREK